jgi:hypothetical protein
MKRYIFNYNIEQVVPYIDWSYLLHAWAYPKEKRQKEL